jgi:hypothetical protein
VKSLKIFRLVLPLLIGVAGGCSTSPLSRIDSDRARYESWPIEVREAVLAGEARKGMTAEQVEMAMGRPSEVVHRGATDADEIWVYRKGSGMGTNLLKNTGLSVGTSIGGVGVGTGTGLGGGGRSSAEEEEVVFVNGVVARSGTSR